jgi:hypothetical protein
LGISIFEQIIISILSGLNDMSHCPDQVLSLFRSWFITNSKVSGLELDGVKLVLWTQTNLPSFWNDASFACFSYTSIMPTLTYCWVSTIVVKNTIILNIIHNIFNLRNTEVFVCNNSFIKERYGWPGPSFKY